MGKDSIVLPFSLIQVFQPTLDMTQIPNAASLVPLMFQAQIEGRCQLQRVTRDEEQQAYRWTSEWVEKAHPQIPEFGAEVQTRTFAISWRFVTNGGQDDGVIRPVIGARGWPFYPGSSMKGVFRRACNREQGDRFCGKALAGGDFEPGILRFHGGYPTDESWQEDLVDIIHPQQNRQVKNNNTSSALVQISLYKPKLNFGISSTIPLEEAEWNTIWELWERALSTGIGCRTCAGYGQPRKHTGNVIYRVKLKGQGAAALLLDKTGEFRPNIFRAALRGHALRIFGGLTDEATAERLVAQMFGGITDGTTVGLLAMSFKDTNLELDYFGRGNWEVPIYEVEGDLKWLLTQTIPEPQKAALTKLVQALTRFAMVLGGFGKSWRRADHRLFYPEYYEGSSQKPLIGCHWQWAGQLDDRVRTLEGVGEFIEEVRQAAKTWMNLQGLTPNPSNLAFWREAWHPQNVQVWGRLAESDEDSRAIEWLHGAYRRAIPTARIPEGSIYRSSVTGRMGHIGRLWHRMYPEIRKIRDPQDPSRPKIVQTRKYLEILTFFPDDSTESKQFKQFLESEQKMFAKIWSNS